MTKGPSTATDKRACDHPGPLVTLPDEMGWHNLVDLELHHTDYDHQPQPSNIPHNDNFLMQSQSMTKTTV